MENPAGATEKQTQRQELQVSFDRARSREFNASSTAPSLNSRAPLSGLGAGKENLFLNETNIIRSDRC